jgi:hypothetical protein
VIFCLRVLFRNVGGRSYTFFHHGVGSDERDYYKAN